LIDHPSDIVGKRLEAGVFSDTYADFRWMCFKPLPSRPRHALAFGGKPKFWFELHNRKIGLNGVGDYNRNIAALDADGEPLLTGVKGQVEPLSKEAGEQLLLTCSVKEDALRSNSFLVSISEGAELLFPVGVEAYQDFFRLRDAPKNTSSGRRNPIIHWVSKHMRKAQNGRPHEVREHKRGTETVEIDGIKATLHPNRPWQG